MSFALGRGGEIYILDQINSRIQVFHGGRRIRTVPLPGETFADVDVLSDGKIVLLDNLVRKEVLILEADGKTAGRHPLGGNAAAVTGVRSLEAGDLPGIWVEMGDRSQRIAYLDGSPDRDRISVPGKWSWDGKRVIRATTIGDATAAVYCSQDRISRVEEFLVSFDKYLVHLLGVWDDDLGRIYLGAFLEEEDRPSNTMVVLTQEGDEVGRAYLWVQQAPHEIYRAFRVSPDGHIYQMGVDGADVFVRRYSMIR